MKQIIFLETEEGSVWVRPSGYYSYTSIPLLRDAVPPVLFPYIPGKHHRTAVSAFGALPLVIKPLLEELCLQASAVCCPGALGTGVGFLIYGNGMEHLPSLPRNLLDFSE